MEVRNIDRDEIQAILDLKDDHFNEVESKRIEPAKLQKTFVSFANADGGDIFIGVEDKAWARAGVKDGTRERVVGFSEQKEANGILFTLLEETTPPVDNLVVEFLEVDEKGLILHIGVPKSPKVHYTASGDCFIRRNAVKTKIKGEKVTKLAYSKGAEPYERKPQGYVD